MLLDTYSSEQDLVAARDDKVESIDSNISHTEQIVDKLRDNLKELQEEAAKMERGGKSVSDELKADIASVKRQISDSRTEIGNRYQQRSAIMAKFEADLARYRELKSGQDN